MSPVAPRNAEDPRVQAGLAAQAAARDRLLSEGARALGWKAGLGTQAAMTAAELQQPLIGHLTDATLVESSGHVNISGWTAPRLEAEVALRLRSPLSPGAGHAEASAAIGAFAPAIELIDAGPPDDIEAVLAGNIFHRAVVLGPFTDLDRVELDGLRLSVDVDDEPVAVDVDPVKLLGDLITVVRALADQAPLAGAGLASGDVLITGAALPALQVVPGAVWSVRSGAAAVTVGLDGPAARSRDR